MWLLLAASPRFGEPPNLASSPIASSSALQMTVISYKAMPERFDLYQTHFSNKVYNSSSNPVYPHGDFSYQPVKGHYRFLGTSFTRGNFQFFARSLDPGGRDLVAYLENPDPLTWEQLRAFLDFIPACADSTILKEGHFLDAKGELDIAIVMRDFPKDFLHWLGTVFN
jgi:hypothetical protein